MTVQADASTPGEPRMISSVGPTPGGMLPMAAAAGSGLLIKRGSLHLKPLVIAPSPPPVVDTSQFDGAPALSLRDTGHISSLTLPHMPLDTNTNTTPAPLARSDRPRPISAAGANASANPQPACTLQVATHQPASVLQSSSSLQLQPHASAPAALTIAAATTAPTSPTPEHTHQLVSDLGTNATSQAPVLASQLAQKLAASLSGSGSSSQDSSSLQRTSTDMGSGSSAEAGAGPPLKSGTFGALQTLRRVQTHGAYSKTVVAADIRFMSPPPLDILVYHGSSKQDEVRFRPKRGGHVGA